MHFHRISIVLLSLALAAACDPAETCAPCRPASPELEALQNTTWLVSSVGFDTVDGRSAFVADGVDVDGFDSGSGDPGDRATCAEFYGDFASRLEPTVSGVDAAAQSVLRPLEESVETGRSIRGDLDEAMAEGRIRWAIRIGSLDEDAERLEIELLTLTEVPVIGPDGRPMPDQTLRARSVASAAAPSFGDSAFLRTETEALTVDAHVTLLPLDQLRVAGILVSADGSGGLRASLGGSFSVDAMVEVAERDAPTFATGPWLDARALFEGAADLEPSADPAICERVSVGLGLETIPVELVVESP